MKEPLQKMKFLRLQNQWKIKSLGNDACLKEFYQNFWASLAEPNSNSIKALRLKNELSSSQKQVVIRHMEKSAKINAS